ncbi:hypothetical protein [Rubrivirga sp.]|uniref:hypothetical protein n=1 Tax=Rubrivirga sp. TaxID=1885344 RepID=UPI003B527977
MSPHRWHAIEALFSRAVELDSAARSLFLDVACRTPDDAPDADLRREVERLLALDPDAQAFFGPDELPSGA